VTRPEQGILMLPQSFMSDYYFGSGYDFGGFKHQVNA
jgi:hypothetical protein